MGHYTITKTDVLGRLVEASEPDYVFGEGYIYSKATYVYDDALDRLTRIDHADGGGAKKQSRYFSYDGYGRLSQENTPEAGVVTYTYTANDLPLTKTDARNVTTTFIYNTRNLATSIGYSDSTPGVTFTYDDFGARQTMTDGEGSMSYVYNGFRQLESETRLFTALTGKQHTLNYTYNLADQPKSVNYAVSQSSGYLNMPVDPSRDASNKVAGLTAPDEQKVETAVEAVARSGERGFSMRPIVSASALRPRQRAQWPSLAQAISPRVIKTALVRRVAGPFTARSFTVSGRVATAQGAGIQGVNVTATGGPFGDASATTGSDGNYTISGLLVEGYNYTVTPSKAGYTFNPTNRYYEAPEGDITGADFTGTAVTYTISGRVTNSQGTGISQVTVTLSGTQSGTTTTNGNGDFSFTNLAAGGNYTVTPSKVGYTFTPTNRSYTNLSANVTNSNFTINAPTPQPFTAFNKNVNYAYNAVGALSGVGTNMNGSDPNATTNVLNSPTFRASGAILGLNYGNGRRLTMGYNANRNQPISMKVDRVSNPSDKIIDYAYDYYDPQGKNNNRIRKITDNVESAFTTDYTYDDYDRLKTASSFFYGTRAYGYDQWGNTTSFAGLTHNYAANASGAPATNRISSDSAGTNFGYDAAGNMTQAGSVTYQYDGAERLKSVNGTSSTYGYDGNGGRVRVTEWDGVTFYVRSSVLGQVAMEVNSSGVRRAYVYAGNKQVAMQSTDGQFYWLHTNHLGSARAMTNASGNLVYKGQFDPYGQTLTEWSPSGNTNLNTRKFTGFERDASGLDYANARMYNSARGRFMQPDPKGLSAGRLRYPLSLNRYTYALNDPVNVVDPAGTDDLYAYCVYVGTWGYEDSDEQFHPLFDEYSCSVIGEGDGPECLDGNCNNYNDGEGGGAATQAQILAQQQAIIDQAVEDTYMVLQLAGECSLFFGGRAFAQNVLSSLHAAMRPLPLTDGNGAPDRKTGIGLTGDYSATMGSYNGIPLNAVYRLPGLAAVNTNGGFYQGSTKTGDYNSSSRRGRALAILHELAHLIGTMDDNGNVTWSIPHDGPGAPDGTSEKSTNTILEKCRRDIESQLLGE
jgi:RHS repeat-associated protein